MAYSTNISFHGVSRIEIGSVDTFDRLGQNWQAVTVTLYAANGEILDSVQFHSEYGETLTVEHEAAEAEAA